MFLEFKYRPSNTTPGQGGQGGEGSENEQPYANAFTSALPEIDVGEDLKLLQERNLDVVRVRRVSCFCFERPAMLQQTSILTCIFLYLGQGY